MALSGLVCPVCNKNLGGLTNAQVVLLGTDNPAQTPVGGHVHLRATATVSCQNGHVWNLGDDVSLTLFRTA